MYDDDDDKFSFRDLEPGHFTWADRVLLFIFLGYIMGCVTKCPSAEAGLWQKMKDSYKEGREEAQVKQVKRSIEERTDQLWREALRRKAEEAKHLDELMKSFRKGNLKIYIIAGVVMLVYLCERGSAGCDTDWLADHWKRKRKEAEEERKRKILDENKREVVDEEDA